MTAIIAVKGGIPKAKTDPDLAAVMQEAQFSTALDYNNQRNNAQLKEVERYSKSTL